MEHVLPAQGRGFALVHIPVIGVDDIPAFVPAHVHFVRKQRVQRHRLPAPVAYDLGVGVVAISTLGGLTDKELFLRGYYEMKKQVNPKQILCFGKPFSEMDSEVIFVDYLKTTGREK